MRTPPRTLRIVTGLAALALGAAACSPPSDTAQDSDDDPLRIGIILASSGPAGALGASEVSGAVAVIEEANENGGVNGRDIEYTIIDDQTDPTAAANAAQQLINQDKVDVIIGSTTGSSTLAFAPLAAAAEIPVLAVPGTISVTSKDNDFWPWVFRAAPSDASSTEATLDIIAADGFSKVAIFAQEDAYGSENLAKAEELAEDAGGLEIVASARAATDATDVSAQVTRIRSANPEVVILYTTSSALGGAVTRALRQAGYDGEIWGSPGLYSPGFLTAAGDAAEGFNVLGFANWNDPSDGEKALTELLEKHGQPTPSAIEILGSNAAELAIAAAQAIDGPIDGPAMRKALEGLCLDTFARGEGACFTEEKRDGFGPDSWAPLTVVDGVFTAA